MKRAIGALAIGLALMFMSVPVQPAPRGDASLTFIQDGIASPDDAVKVDQPFVAHGEGFRSFSPAWVCPAGNFCVKTPVNSDGSFNVEMVLHYAGDYIITVYQYRNASGKSSDEVLVTTLTVI